MARGKEMSHDLYFLYDKYGELLYVGESQDAHKRILNHEKRAWGHLIFRRKVITFSNAATAKETAQRHEMEAIKYEHPKYNLKHNPDELAARQALAEIGEFDKSGKEHCYEITWWHEIKKENADQLLYKMPSNEEAAFLHQWIAERIDLTL